MVRNIVTVAAVLMALANIAAAQTATSSVGSSSRPTSAPASASAAGDKVTTIDARTFVGTCLVITADAVEITVNGQAQKLPRADVADIYLAKPADAMSNRGQAVLVTNDGSMLAVGEVSLSGSKFTVSNTLLGKTELPMDSVKAIYTPSANMSARQVQDRCAELKFTSSTNDTLVVAKGETDWIAVEGVLKAIDPKGIAFALDDNEGVVNPKTVQAILVAMLGGKPAALAGSVIGIDGSVVGFTSIATDGQSISVDAPGIGSKKLARVDVAAIRFASDRMVHLGDLTPIETKQYGMFDNKFPYRVNLSIGGKELRLGGQSYETGLGLHSFCELTYNLDGTCQTFVALAGIDDAVRPGGDATLTILGDGKELEKAIRLTGKDDPQLVRVKVAGVKKLTIRVDFGQDKLDVSDHVDLAAARLIK